MTSPYAVVVGIESYAAGPQWTLNGPQSDAARFTRWLRARGVEPAQIALFLSPGAGDVDDVPSQCADEASVFACLNALQNRAADPFIFFWSGHGVAGSDSQRLLFLSDAKPGNFVNLDFSQLLTAMRTNPYSALTRQVFFVDACANYVYDPAFIDALPRRTIPGHTQNPRIEQVVALAAREGETARNDPERRTGVFTAAILDRLDAVKSPADLFVALPEATKEVAKQLAAQGERQRPALIEMKDAGGNVDITGAPPPSTPAPVTLSPDQRIELARRLLKSNALSNPQNRQTIIGLLPDDIRLNVVRDNAALTDVLNLLEACDAYDDGMATFLRVVRRFAGNSVPINDATKYYESLRSPSW